MRKKGFVKAILSVIIAASTLVTPVFAQTAPAVAEAEAKVDFCRKDYEEKRAAYNEWDGGDITLGFNSFVEWQNAWADLMEASYEMFGSRKQYNDNKPVTSIFSDVKANAWYVDDIQDIYNKEIMTGKDATHFNPGQSLSRAEVAMVLWRLCGCPNVEYNPTAFTDVAENEWYTKAVMWAHDANIITGYMDGRFGAKNPCTREQLTVMLFRFLASTYCWEKGRDYPVTITTYEKHFRKTGYCFDNSLDSFIDKDKVSEYADVGMQWAVKSDLIRGKENGTRIDPQGLVSRAECAAIISRFTR